MTVRVSVVVPTFNRAEALIRLLKQLSDQTLPRSAYELIVVDDGSVIDVASILEREEGLGHVLVERKSNGGAAAARHHGAVRARGEVLLFVDDDMQVRDDFIARHLLLHDEAPNRVVLGRIVRDPTVQLPLFERWHAEMIDKVAEQAKSGALRLRGNHLFTGNASVRAEDYLAAGGFDESLGHSEDVELGLRLEKLGCEFVLAHEAVSFHGSDHAQLDRWLERAFLYGRYDHRIARKHPDLPHANPWRRSRELNPLTRVALLLSVVAPALSEQCARFGMKLCNVLERSGSERLALFGTSAAFTMQYFRGVREELGSFSATAADARAALMG